MGNQVSAASSQTGTLTQYLSEIPEYTYIRDEGSTRFLKVVRCKRKQEQVLVKFFIKQDKAFNYRKYKSKILHIFKTIDQTHTLPYVKVIETERCIFLLRPFVSHNLYDRISTRPFLNITEKKWIVFQVMLALKRAHERGIFHGDIKTENILLTSWNWVLLTDFASYKPAYIPEDNPAAFAYFYGISGRRICYLAPERFYNPNKSKQTMEAALVSVTDEFREGTFNDKMDVFSLGKMK